MDLMVVTGTGTGVGKTVTTAALVVCALRARRSVAVVKPVQTGVSPDEPGDMAEVARLSGHADVHELARFAEPLAPATAARRAGQNGPGTAELAAGVRELAGRDLVIVEGAGGALVRFNSRGDTLLDLVEELGAGRTVRVLLVVSSGLGVLNTAALTAEALARRRIGLMGMVVGDWPDEPDLACRCNLTDLSAYAGAPVLGVLPTGAGATEGPDFHALATRSLAPALGGSLDLPAFIAAHTAPPPHHQELT